MTDTRQLYENNWCRWMEWTVEITATTLFVFALKCKVKMQYLMTTSGLNLPDYKHFHGPVHLVLDKHNLNQKPNSMQSQWIVKHRRNGGFELLQIVLVVIDLEKQSLTRTLDTILMIVSSFTLLHGRIKFNGSRLFNLEKHSKTRQLSANFAEARNRYK